MLGQYFRLNHCHISVRIYLFLTNQICLIHFCFQHSCFYFRLTKTYESENEGSIFQWSPSVLRLPGMSGFSTRSEPHLSTRSHERATSLRRIDHMSTRHKSRYGMHGSRRRLLHPILLGMVSRYDMHGPAPTPHDATCLRDASIQFVSQFLSRPPSTARPVALASHPTNTPW
jgi:hypothetical protein